MSEPQTTKNTRRKRKDPESRDFTCACGKSYLSYAAAYTHVKNKHNGEKSMLKTIQKPERQQLKRGRPKQKRQIANNTQTEVLSIIQQAILQLHNLLKDRPELEHNKLILEGNQEISQQQINQQYSKLIAKYPLNLNIFENQGRYGDVIQFQNSLNKHFSIQIAAKIRWYINYIMQHDDEKNQQQLKENGYRQVNEIIIWKQIPEIKTIINQTYKKWSDTMEKGKSP